MTQTETTGPIDAVITWVDGRSNAHRENRARFLAQNVEAVNENARNPHRWESNDEIYFCLLSIHNHAPWVRHIWIVVESGGPDLTQLPEALRVKVQIATHDEIFDGHANILPTFNSLAIESVMWRIGGLSERFLYFNDDVFLTAPLVPDDVFAGDNPVLRGTWRDFGSVAEDANAQGDPALFNHFMQINAAALCGAPPTRVFATAHVVHPMRRSVMEHLFQERRVAFEANISYRFRNIRQFLPQGLHNHHCIAVAQAQIATDVDHLHIKSGQGVGNAPDVTRALLLPDALAKVKFLCVNDLPQLEDLVCDARALIIKAIGGGLA